MKKLLICCLWLTAIPCYAQHAYQAPPTSTTSSYVPVISDEMMKKCVQVYNESKWLQDELNAMKVNQYSQAEVNRYNKKAKRINEMIRWFNDNCAGKQSRSACEAAQKLNREKGLPTQPCR